MVVGWAAGPWPPTPLPRGIMPFVELFGRTRSELADCCEALGHPSYRGKQIADWLYRKSAREIAAMTNLPASFRDQLAACATLTRSAVLNESRSAGLRMLRPSHGLARDMKIEVTGTMQTNADGERYIAVSDITHLGAASVAPLGMCNRALVLM